MAMNGVEQYELPVPEQKRERNHRLRRWARLDAHGLAAGGSRYSAGLPTPAAGGGMAATVSAGETPTEDGRCSLAWLALVSALAALAGAGHASDQRQSSIGAGRLRGW